MTVLWMQAPLLRPWQGIFRTLGAKASTIRHAHCKSTADGSGSRGRSSPSVWRKPPARQCKTLRASPQGNSLPPLLPLDHHHRISRRPNTRQKSSRIMSLPFYSILSISTTF